MQSNETAPIIFDTKVFRSTIAGLIRKMPVIVHQGGTYSGKTFSILAAIHQYLDVEREGERLVTSVVSCTMPHLKRGALRDFQEITQHLGGFGSWQKSDNIFRIGGGIIEFFSADDDGKVRGGKRDILFVNEGNLINYERYRQLAMRTRQTVIIDYNPVAEFWCHEHILKRQDILFKRSTYLDNPATPKKVIDDIERLKDIDPELYRIYALGLTGNIQGLIYSNFELVNEFPAECKRVCYGLDFGFSNDPTALVKFGYLHGEIFAEELIYETGLTNQDIARKFRELNIYQGAEIFADSAEPKSIEEIRREGFNIRPAQKGPDSIRHGINLIKQHKVNLTKSSTNMDKERRNYRWKEDRDGNATDKPIDAFNHGLDALRYAATMKLRPGGLSFAKR